MTRQALDTLNGQFFDVVVIGAGAVGCASARELAGRGYRVLLVDRGDFGAGTSSRSSRLLYSGLGYLVPEYPLWQIPLHPSDMLNRLRYTRQVMRCRAELVEKMPDHLEAHDFYYPFRNGDRFPTWLVGFGFKLLEALGGWRVPLGYCRLRSAFDLAEHLDDSLTGVAKFQEYMYAWPERICVDTALDAERRGATIRTYTAVTGLQHDGERWNIALAERAPNTSGTAQIHSRLIVNAAGPWIDRIPGGGNKQRVLGVKGVNVVLRLPKDMRGKGLQAFSSTGVPFYVFPWRDLHYVGSTETIYTANPDAVSVGDEEIDYLLAEANILFPQLKLNRSHVQHVWCGVRPCSTRDGQEPVMEVRLVTDPEMPGMFSMTGAQMMLHRHAARLAASAVERSIGRRGPPPEDAIRKPSMDRDVAEVIQHEHVVTLTDLLRRRLPGGLDADLGRSGAEGVSRKMASALNWDEGRRGEELQRFEEDVIGINPTLSQLEAQRPANGTFGQY